MVSTCIHLEVIYFKINAIDDGTIFSWDLGMRKCVSQFNDQGFIGGGSIAVSGDNKYLATG